jgi:Protein of unknown function (DUF1499)
MLHIFQPRPCGNNKNINKNISLRSKCLIDRNNNETAVAIMKLSSISLIPIFVGCASALSVDRRAALTQAAASVAIPSFASVVGAFPANAAAVPACPPNSSNCIRTTWTVPADRSPKNIGESMVAILNSYPQEGQNKVDLGGWKVAEGDLIKTGKARVEYISGIGNFAKFFNGGKPFVDDLDIEIVGNSIELRSASRIGESDFDVNKKRLQFLGSKAKAFGWTVPEPKY